MPSTAGNPFGLRTRCPRDADARVHHPVYASDLDFFFHAQVHQRTRDQSRSSRQGICVDDIRARINGVLHLRQNISIGRQEYLWLGQHLDAKTAAEFRRGRLRSRQAEERPAR